MALLTFDLAATFPTGGGIAGSLAYESVQTPIITNEATRSYATYALTSWSLAVTSGTPHLPNRTFSNALGGHTAEFAVEKRGPLVGTVRLFDETDLLLMLAWALDYEDLLARPPADASEWGSFRQSHYRVWPTRDHDERLLGSVPVLVFSEGALTLAA